MSEILSAKPTSEPPHPQRKHSRVAFHAPCSLQHGLRRHGEIEALLKAQGFEFSPVSDAHLCCGAAGTYAVFQAGISERLGEQKVEALERNSPDVIATANIGCLIHLEKRARVPVRHWIELIDEAESS
jgi:glycolate oxidase iron-sulfur subunit